MLVATTSGLVVVVIQSTGSRVYVRYMHNYRLEGDI